MSVTSELILGLRDITYTIYDHIVGLFSLFFECDVATAFANLAGNFYVLVEGTALEDLLMIPVDIVFQWVEGSSFGNMNMAVFSLTTLLGIMIVIRFARSLNVFN